jgi:hypothetical protein
VTIIRLRPRHSASELQRIYSAPHDHRIYGRGHAERVNAMIELGNVGIPWSTAADLSCGNGVVIDSITILHTRYKGDFAPGYEFIGPIEETIQQIPSVDLFIMGETLEHLDDPKSVLVDIRDRAEQLLLSTPIYNWGDTNAEHYWAWSQGDVEDLLRQADWNVLKFTMVDSRTYGEPYCYGIWLCD